MLRLSQVLVVIAVVPLFISIILAVTAPTFDSWHPAVWFRVRVVVVVNIGLTLLFGMIWYQFELRSSISRAVTFIAIYLLSLIALWTNFNLVASEPTTIGLLSYTALSVFIHTWWSAFLMLLADVARCAYLKLTGRGRNAKDVQSQHHNRRDVATSKVNFNLKLLFGFAYVIILSAQGFYVALQDPEVVHVDLYYNAKVDGISRDFDGYRIVQLTDVHLGPSIGASRLAGVVDQVNRLNPDIVVITGDLVDAPHEHLHGALLPLRDLRAPVYYVTGNHEFYYHGIRAWLQELRKLGVHTLVNEATVLQASRSRDADASLQADAGATLCLSGMHDLQATKMKYEDERSNFTAAFRSCPADSPVVLLVHQPQGASLVLETSSEEVWTSVYGVAQISLAERRRRVKLVLSGHTHAGQVAPMSYFLYFAHTRFVSRFFNGLYEVPDLHTPAHSYVYVSAGTFFGCLPMRTGSLMEISEVVLHVS